MEDFVRNTRIRLFGHVLRLPKDTPAQKAMDAYFRPGKRDKGRPKHHLPTRLVKDMNKVWLAFKSHSNLNNLRTIASDRKLWKRTFFGDSR